uniref:Uncharacterized protein n=1 Tax=Arundo donax TaxID=35708 RepID=A0A0A9CM67_ARUDO
MKQLITAETEHSKNMERNFSRFEQGISNLCSDCSRLHSISNLSSDCSSHVQQNTYLKLIFVVTEAKIGTAQPYMKKTISFLHLSSQ